MSKHLSLSDKRGLTRRVLNGTPVARAGKLYGVAKQTANDIAKRHAEDFFFASQRVKRNGEPRQLKDYIELWAKSGLQ